MFFSDFRVRFCLFFVSMLVLYMLNRYAAAPHELRTDWSKFTKDYFLNRSTLVSVFLLIDASIPAKSIDLEYASWLGQNQVLLEKSVKKEMAVT